MPARPSGGSGSSRGRWPTSPRPSTCCPEALLPVVGAADDALVIGWAIKAFVEETDRFVEWERWPRRSGGADLGVVCRAVADC